MNEANKQTLPEQAGTIQEVGPQVTPEIPPEVAEHGIEASIDPKYIEEQHPGQVVATGETAPLQSVHTQPVKLVPPSQTVNLTNPFIKLLDTVTSPFRALHETVNPGITGENPHNTAPWKEEVEKAKVAGLEPQTTNPTQPEIQVQASSNVSTTNPAEVKPLLSKTQPTPITSQTQQPVQPQEGELPNAA